VIELGEFTREQLAARVEPAPGGADLVLGRPARQGHHRGGDDERMAYQPTGRENVVTRRRHAPPEQEVIDSG
jgi:hypothetical protein